MQEEWRAIPDLDMYWISNEGNIKRGAYDKVQADGSVKQIDEVSLPTTIFQNSRYVSIKGKSYLVHLLVANAFLDKPEPSSRIEFIDNDRTNCRADNLKWVSISDIVKKDIAEGRRSNPTPYTGVKIECVESGETYSSIKALCERLGLPRSYVTKRVYSKEPINGQVYKRVYR